NFSAPVVDRSPASLDCEHFMVLAPGFLSEICCLNHLQLKQTRQDHDESEPQQNAGGHHSPSLLSRLEHGSQHSFTAPQSAPPAALPDSAGAPVWDAGRPTPPDHSVGGSCRAWSTPPAQ